MKTTPDDLPNDIEKLKTLLLAERRASSEKIQALEAKTHYLLEQFPLAQQKQYGKSSEAYAGKGNFFNEAEQILDETVEPEVETLSYTRNKP